MKMKKSERWTLLLFTGEYKIVELQSKNYGICFLFSLTLGI
jgi:hypothetical protein